MIKGWRLMVRLALGGLLIYASFGKITHAEEFATAMSNYRMLPSGMVFLGSLVMPWLELLLGLLLLTGVWKSTSTFMTSVLFLVFTMAVAQAIVRGVDISCGCFDLTATEDRISSLTLVRNLFLFACSLSIMTHPKKDANPACVG